MKLALCLFHYQLHSGLSRDFIAVAHEALRRGHSVDVFTQSWNGGETSKDSHFSVHIIPPSGVSNHSQSMNFAKACLAQFKAGDFDAVIGFNRMPGLSHYFAADLSFMAQAARRRGGLFKFTGRYKSYAELERAVFCSDSRTHIFVLNKPQGDEYRAQHNTAQERFSILPPAVDMASLTEAKTRFDREQFRRTYDIPSSSYVLLMVGSNFTTKGVDRSIAALAKLAEPIRSRCLLIVLGDGKGPAMQRLARQLGVGQRTRIMGPSDEVFQWMLAADLLLQPSRIEAGGNSILEALAAGLPVLVSDNCGFAEHVSKAKAGTLIRGEPFSTEQFSEQILIGLGDRKREQWRANAAQYCANTPLNGRAAALLDTVEAQTGL